MTKDKTLLSVIKDGYDESRMHDWIDRLESVTVANFFKANNIKFELRIRLNHNIYIKYF